MKFFLILILLPTVSTKLSSQVDTIEEFVVSEMNSNKSLIVTDLTIEESAILDQSGYKFVAKANKEFSWKLHPDKSITCDGLVKRLKLEDNGKLNSICLACFNLNNELQHMGACISMLKMP